MTKIHLDTDIGGDMDDLCALAMLLRWPDLEITGVTTVSEEHGRRAGYAYYVLNLVGALPLLHFEPGGPRRMRVRTASSSSESLPAKLSCHQVAPASA